MNEGTEPPTDRTTRLATYLAEHRDRYTPEALHRAAVEAGYTDAEVAAAMAVGGPVVGRTDPAPVSSGRRALLPTIGTVIAFVGGLWLASAAINALTYDTSIGLVVYVIAIVGAAVGWRTLRESHPSVARGLGCSVILAFVLPIVVVVAIIGFCIATNQRPLG